MIRFAPLIVEMGLLIYCLIDCVGTPDTQVRTLPKIGWIILILLVPLVGGIAWLVAGRPQRESTGAAVPWRSGKTARLPEYERPSALAREQQAIDDRLRAEQAQVDREHEEALRRWEQSRGDRKHPLPADDEPPAS